MFDESTDNFFSVPLTNPSADTTPLATASPPCPPSPTPYASSPNVPPYSPTSYSSEDTFCGWLWKRSSVFSRWKYRFFYLQGPLLTYYKSLPVPSYVNATSASCPSIVVNNEGEVKVYTNSTVIDDDSNPVGVMRVANVEIATNSKIAFKVYSVSGKVLDVRTDKAETCQRWVVALMNVSSKYGRKLLSNEENPNGSLFSVMSASNDNSFSFLETNENLNASVSTLPNYVEKQGWMDYRTKGKVQHHYFVIQGSMIAYYEDDLPWRVPLCRGYVENVTELKAPIVQIEFSVRSKKRIFELKLPNEKLRNEWILAFQNAKEESENLLQCQQEKLSRQTI